MNFEGWKDCIEEGEAFKSFKDKGRVKSLIETAKSRINLINEITKENCNFVFEDYYISILELLQALVILDGFKVKNHVCLGFYLRDVLGKDELFRIFDDLRFKRNALTYYGNQMDFETCKEAIKKSKKLINELNSIIIKRLKNTN